MAIIEPESMEDILYFTNRTIDKGKVKAWVYKIECPKCHKVKIGKPLDKKTGKPKLRAKEYSCSNCDYTESKEEHENKLKLEIKYTCPYCGHSGEAIIAYKRKTFEGIPSYVFVCDKCEKKIAITKKMKNKKSDDV